MHKVPKSQVGSRSGTTHSTVPLGGTAAPWRCSVMRRGANQWAREPDGATSHALLCPGAPWDGDNGRPLRGLSGSSQATSKLQQHGGGIVGRTEGFGVGGQRCIRKVGQASHANGWVSG